MNHLFKYTVTIMVSFKNVEWQFLVDQSWYSDSTQMAPFESVCRCVYKLCKVAHGAIFICCPSQQPSRYFLMSGSTTSRPFQNRSVLGKRGKVSKYFYLLAITSSLLYKFHNILLESEIAFILKRSLYTIGQNLEHLQEREN